MTGPSVARQRWGTHCSQCGKTATLAHMPTVASRDLRNHTKDVLDQVSEGVAVHGRPVAEIRPISPVIRTIFERLEAVRILTAARSVDDALSADLEWISGETTDDLGPIA